MTPTTSALHVSTLFDSGAIEVESLERADDIRLRVRADSHADFRQWFHFRLQGAAGQACKLKFLNAGECTYPDGWRDYRVVASYDRAHWFRVPTQYDGATMTADVTPEHDSIWFAYFEPYPEERHLSLLASCQRSPLARLSHLGRTVDGRDLTCVTVGQPGPGKKTVWMIARQHPGESMAEWWMEGALERLTDDEDAVARYLRQKATFHIVPNMNPDGSRRGHLRTNAAGINLNREWHEPSMDKSPEVYLVRAAMDETGVDFAMDVHGDEAIPAVFIAGFEGIPSITERQLALYHRYRDTLAARTPDFQTRLGYPTAAPGKANLAMSTNQVAERFGAVAMTLEMPFKDNDDLPDADYGWSPARSIQLGKDCLATLAEMIDAI